MLTVSGLTASYGAIRAVRGVSLDVKAGSLSVLLGANGAGKSTTLRSIAGLHRPVEGSIRLGREEISRLDLSRFAGREAGSDGLERVFTLFPRLKERRWQKAGLLSGGEQQMLAIGRALMTKPTMMVLDEPSMGLAPAIVDLVFEAIVALHAQGQSILLVEQNAALALSVANYGYVMKRGEIVLEGSPADLTDNPEVLEAYLS